MTELPTIPPPPSFLNARAPSVKEQLTERALSKALQEEVIRIYRCECQRCGYVWRTKDLVKPVACAGCHNAYWDRPAMWRRKTKAERVKEKLQKKLEKKQRETDFNNKLKEQIDLLIKEAEEKGEDVGTLRRKAARFAVDVLKTDGRKKVSQEADSTKGIYEETMEILGRVGRSSLEPISEGVSDGTENVLQETAQGSDGVFVPARDYLSDYTDVESGQSDGNGFGENNSN
jgi:predicted Zn-ribbon and HTH transcriptional regulator